MTTVTYTSARQNLKSIFDQACDNAETIIVTRKNGKNVVILSEEDFRSLDEMSYLLSNPANRKHLEESIEEVENKKIHSFDSLEDLKNAI